MYSFVLYSGIWDNKLSMKGLGFHNAWWSNFKDGLPVVGFTPFPSGESFLVLFHNNFNIFYSIFKNMTELQDRRPKCKSDLKFTLSKWILYVQTCLFLAYLIWIPRYFALLDFDKLTQFWSLRSNKNKFRCCLCRFSGLF